MSAASRVEIDIGELSPFIEQHFASGVRDRAPNLFRSPRFGHELLAMSVRAQIEPFIRMSANILQRIRSADYRLCSQRLFFILGCGLHRENTDHIIFNRDSDYTILTN